MRKKKLLLSILVASLFVVSALGLDACKKTEGDSIPTEINVLRGASDTAICLHCGNTIWDRNWYCLNPEGPHWDLDDWRVFHVHEYQIGEVCAVAASGWCRWNKMHHRHEVYYFVDTIDGHHHYEDNWIHIGGGGGGE